MFCASVVLEDRLSESSVYTISRHPVQYCLLMYMINHLGMSLGLRQEMIPGSRKGGKCGLYYVQINNHHFREPCNESLYWINVRGKKILVVQECCCQTLWKQSFLWKQRTFYSVPWNFPSFDPRGKGKLLCNHQILKVILLYVGWLITNNRQFYLRKDD